ncbi:hemolysin [Candidatus Methylomirabilis lanthanidiphila]|uniref:Hemolysin n=1 Tax=Candidatus Methylomirabilis lanthanidiphila TaxID=2211376 RepID=A0A564ZHY4_9BACT|nr:TlyA family RNA methyltransferase [Candidatus Methylomirabilis lanthanidiphila]VUZ84939.1 hemolysin [Candidatus Methylomirabilis lanthanidiphila]
MAAVSRRLLSDSDCPVTKKGGRIRLDLAMQAQGLAGSRERARALILAGVVLVDGRLVDKAGTLIASDARISLMVPEHPYVGRGGVKLQGALEQFAISVTGRVCLDLGASTGGFTDCLLQYGAAHVYAVDVGYGQLDVKLRADPRVTVMERTHALTLLPTDFPDRPDLATVDLSFISLASILPVVPSLLADSGEILALIKPQFEVGKGHVGKGGVVRDPEAHRLVITKIGRRAVELGLRILGAAPSCLLGPKGNREFFIYLSTIGISITPEEAAEQAVGACPEPSRRESA